MSNARICSGETHLFLEPSPGPYPMTSCQGSKEPFFVSNNQPDGSSPQDFALELAIDALENKEKWDSLSFNFSDSYMVGGGVMEANGNTRLSTCLRSLRLAAANSIEESKPQTADIKLRASSRYMKENVRIADGVQKQRQAILPAEVVAKRLESKLRTENDPVVQLGDEVSERYSDSIEALQINRLKTDLILITKPDTIKSIYRKYIDTYRVLGESLLRFMMQ